MIAPNTFAQDTTVYPVMVSTLALIPGQIQGIGTIYANQPQGDLDDNSVSIVPHGFDFVDDTIGKMRLHHHFDFLHVWRFVDLPTNLTIAAPFLMPWAQALSAVANTSLNGLAVLTEPTKGTWQFYKQGATLYFALVLPVTVSTEFTIQ